jgi:hypothetical protein
MVVIEMKPIQGEFSVKYERAIKMVSMDTEAGIAHWPMDLLHGEHPGLLLEPLHHCSFYVFN